ncbi:hypothetical protein D3C75_801750 [compost metagenome]
MVAFQTFDGCQPFGDGTNEAFINRQLICCFTSLTNELTEVIPLAVEPAVQVSTYDVAVVVSSGARQRTNICHHTDDTQACALITFVTFEATLALLTGQTRNPLFEGASETQLLSQLVSVQTGLALQAGQPSGAGTHVAIE